MMAHYRRTGTLPHLHRYAPAWGDFTSSEDLTDVFERVHAMEDTFSQLPADVRTAAENDPAVFFGDLADGNVSTYEAAGLQISDTPIRTDNPSLPESSRGVRGNEGPPPTSTDSPAPGAATPSSEAPGNPAAAGSSPASEAS